MRSPGRAVPDQTLQDKDFAGQSEDMVTSAYAQTTDAAPTAVADLINLLMTVLTTLPVWLLVALALGAVGLLVLLVIMLRSRFNVKEAGESVAGPRRPQRAANLDDAVADAVDPINGHQADDRVAPDVDPVMETMADELSAHGVTGDDLDAGLRRFAGGLDDLLTRLQTLGDETADRSPLLHEAETAVRAGDVERGIDLLISAADAEANASTGAKNQSDSHGRAAAEARMIAADLLSAEKALGEAVTLYKRALDVVPEDEPELRVECLNRLGAVYVTEGAFDPAAQVFMDALSIMERHLGANHGDLTPLLNNLALAKDGAGETDEAEQIYQRALDLDERLKGPSHPDVAADLNNLGLLYKRAGRSGLALPLLRRSLKIKRDAYPEGHPSLVTGLRNLAAALRDEGDIEQAALLEREANILPPSRTHTDPESESA